MLVWLRSPSHMDSSPPRLDLLPCVSMHSARLLLPTCTICAMCHAPAASQGFVLQPSNVSEIMSAAQDMLDGQIFADPALAPDQNLNTLVRLVRLLQVGLDLQLTENEDLSSDFNRLQDEFAVGAGACLGELRRVTMAEGTGVLRAERTTGGNAGGGDLGKTTRH
eukprot:353588-Chlamydomonas_euryale.AAC.7